MATLQVARSRYAADWNYRLYIGVCEYAHGDSLRTAHHSSFLQPSSSLPLACSHPPSSPHLAGPPSSTSPSSHRTSSPLLLSTKAPRPPALARRSPFLIASSTVRALNYGVAQASTRPNPPARPPTIWICGPRAYTLCTFLIKRYCNCGLTSKHHGLHYRLPPLPLPHPQPPTSRSTLSVVPSGRPFPPSPPLPSFRRSSLARSFIRSSFVHYRVRIKLPTCNRRYPPRGSPGAGAGEEEGD